MMEARRRAYLEALGFDVWIARSAAAEPVRLGVGAGRGSTLLVCSSRAECETDLASDIARAVGDDPVWAWLESAPDAGTQRLEDLIASQLITGVLLFGPDTARALFQGEVPEIAGSATVSLAPPLQELAASGIVRRDFWQRLHLLRNAQGAGSRG